ncbi:MAG: hypothetical protein AAF628_25550 [Planctomycetota bacterium]
MAFPTSLSSTLAKGALGLAAATLSVGLAAQATTYGTSCGGLAMGSSGSPTIGSTSFTIDLSGAPAGTVAYPSVGTDASFWRGVPLPLSLAVLQAPGCFLNASLDGLLPPVLTTPGGTASTPLPLPTMPALIGGTVYFQWIVVDLPANPLGLTFSDGLRVDIQAPPTFEDRLYAFFQRQLVPSTGLLESYVSNPGLPTSFANYLSSSRPAFIYDNALAVLALLDRASASDRALAAGILDAIVGIQNANGSLPDEVHAATLAASTTGDTGNQSWAILALVRGFEVLGNASYLTAATAAADYVVNNSENTMGFGGFFLNPSSDVVSTEHNLDLYAALERLAVHLPTMGAGLTSGDALDAATHARIFAESRYDPAGGFSYTGTTMGGVQTNPSPVPADVQTWGALALGRNKWLSGYNWLRSSSLWTSSSSCPTLSGTAINGPSFSDADTGEVWFEGLAHAHVAAQFAGDAATVSAAEAVLQAVQSGGAQADQLGLMATCGTLDTGFGFNYYSALGLAPTAWALLGMRDVNPFWNVAASGGSGSHPAGSLPSVSINAPAGGTYTCAGGVFGPCSFGVSGSSTNVAGSGFDIYILVEPKVSSPGVYFTQYPAVTVNPGGTWSGTGRLGDLYYPASPGEPLCVFAIVWDRSMGLPPPISLAVTKSMMMGLRSVTGLVNSTVQ